MEILRRETADPFDIRARVLELAKEAQWAGFHTAGYLLEMAALEIENASGSSPLRPRRSPRVG